MVEKQPCHLYICTQPDQRRLRLVALVTIRLCRLYNYKLLALMRLCMCGASYAYDQNQGPIVQSIVSFTSSLRGQLVK